MYSDQKKNPYAGSMGHQKLLFQSCSVITGFWGEVINTLNTVLQQSLIFNDTYVILNDLPVTWRLSVGGRKLTLCVLTMAKKDATKKLERKIH